MARGQKCESNEKSVLQNIPRILGFWFLWFAFFNPFRSLEAKIWQLSYLPDNKMSAGQDEFLSRPKAEWTPTRDAYLVELLIEQHNNGRIAYKDFKNEVLQSVTGDFNKKFGLNFEENQVKNRYTVMKKEYGVVKTLLTNKEFSWDETRQKVVADDKVWDSYIPAHCEARPFRRRGFPLYKQMSILFEGERGIPTGHYPSGTVAAAEEGNSNTETVQSSEPCNLPTQAMDGTLESDSLIRINNLQTKKQTSINPSSDSIRKKRSYEKIGETIENALYEVFTAAKTKAKQRNASNVAIYQNCLEELQKLEDLDDNEFAKAVNALKDDKNAIAFMTIKGPRRLTWLKSLWHSD